jgi:hypothetical protein
MKRTILVFAFTLLALTCAGLLFFKTPSAHAKDHWFTNWDLRGAYASQMTGTLLFPANSPLAAFNGPAAYTGRVVADGRGNLTGNVTANINGLVTSGPVQGNYVVNDDGTVDWTSTITVLGQTAQQVAFGVICDEGKQLRFTMVGPTVPDPRMPGGLNAMSVLTGSWIRQREQER